MTIIHSELRKTLDRLEKEHRLRRSRVVSSPQRPEIEIDGQRAVDFCSNDYLGFSRHPRLIEAARETLEGYGTGTGGARLIGGTLDLHAHLEEQLALFKGTEAALLFNSGYQANLGLLSALVGRHDLIFSDRLNHASLVDGAMLSRGKLVRYPHLDVGWLEERLRLSPKGVGKFIVTDTVFSMDGDLAPLETLFDLATRYDAWLILDEAHATGVFGPHFRSGLWEATGLGPQERVIQMGTFSKALGGFGAYVAASRDVVETLAQFSRSFIYSTSLPPAVVGGNLAAIELLRSDATRTNALWGNVRAFLQQTEAIGLPLKGESPVIPLLVGEEAVALEYGKALLEAGFYVQPIRPPTVPDGTARLRITLSALHTTEHIQQLVSALKGIQTHESVERASRTLS